MSGLDAIIPDRSRIVMIWFSACSSVSDRFEPHRKSRQRKVDDRADGDAPDKAEGGAQHPVKHFKPRTPESRASELAEHEAGQKKHARDKKEAARASRSGGLDDAESAEQRARRLVEASGEDESDDESGASDQRAHETAQRTRGHGRTDDCKHEQVEDSH